MSEFEETQRLIRLKRHERPSEDFVEQFVSDFRERQRAELLQHSARSLLWERVTTYFSGLLNPKWAWAGATAVAVAIVALMIHPGAQGGAGAIAKNGSKNDAGSFEVKNVSMGSGSSVTPEQLARLQHYLLKNHFEGGIGHEQQQFVRDRVLPSQGLFPNEPLPASAAFDGRIQIVPR